jgi:HlyD family secretion protein
MTPPDLSSLRIRRDDPPPAPAAPRRRAWWIWVVLVVLVAAAAGYFLSRGSGSFAVTTASVSRIAPGSASSVLTATGYVVAQRKAAVASKGTGRLEVLNVEEGDHIDSGGVIGRLEAKDVTASLQAARAAVTQAAADVAQAEATAKEAKLAYNRSRALLADALVAQSSFDEAEARHHTAQAAVEAAKAALQSARANAAYAEVQVENTYIRAPFDGTVLTKDADVGEVVAPFASSASSRGAVVTLADMSSLEVEADVSESNIRQVQVGQPCLITLDALPAEPYRGSVNKIVPTAARSKATVMTKIAFAALDSRVLPEMSARVTFLPVGSDTAAIDTRTVLCVPASAVVERGGRSVAFTASQGRASMKVVETGRRFGGTLEVVSGLEEGQIVILDPPPRLRQGSRVQPKS